ncbi:hypothetical protein F5878DRAFT_645849 [Lentinula raphanica]|uniref:Uncharacterized protein n=1 Tax=Lentinula raphanica TaxID=153919 RepID=A0AA38NZY6_9AGAR|nr:hypothetical protein F5878DRAFT_645849 [Lentinula raphanica]
MNGNPLASLRLQLSHSRASKPEQKEAIHQICIERLDVYTVLPQGSIGFYERKNDRSEVLCDVTTLSELLRFSGYLPLISAALKADNDARVPVGTPKTPWMRDSWSWLELEDKGNGERDPDDEEFENQATGGAFSTLEDRSSPSFRRRSPWVQSGKPLNLRLLWPFSAAVLLVPFRRLNNRDNWSRLWAWDDETLELLNPWRGKSKALRRISGFRNSVSPLSKLPNHEEAPSDLFITCSYGMNHVQYTLTNELLKKQLGLRIPFPDTSFVTVIFNIPPTFSCGRVDVVGHPKPSTLFACVLLSGTLQSSLFLNNLIPFLSVQKGHQVFIAL